MSQGRPNILIAHGLDDELLAQIEETAPNASLRLRKREEVTVEDMTWADIFFGWPPRKFLKEAPGLSWIHLPSAGADGYTDPGIYAHSDVILTNSTGVFGIPLAEHAFAMMLAFSRTINRYIRLQQERRWEKLPSSDELYGKTLGILGLGDIGTQLALRAKAFGMKVLAWSPNLKPERAAEVGVTAVDKQTLLREADVVSLHVPQLPSTQWMIGAAEIGRASCRERVSFLV